MAKETDLAAAKKVARDNLETLRIYLVHCVDEGMLDSDDEFYNKTLGLIDDTSVLTTWDELAELIDRAKVLEQDIDVWLSLHGRTSLSLLWPTVE